jgi:hypothetical protein
MSFPEAGWGWGGWRTEFVVRMLPKAGVRDEAGDGRELGPGCGLWCGCER